VLYHLPPWGGVGDNAFVHNAYLMVDLFFVLSGFVISRAYGERLHSLRDLGQFQFLRFGRLYPVHLLFLLVFGGIELAKHIAATRYGLTSPNAHLQEQGGLALFVQNLLLVHAVLPNQPHGFNYPSWSISVEFYTYLVFGAVTLGLARWRVPVFIALAGGACVLLGLHAVPSMESPLRCLAGFFIGCLTQQFSKARQHEWSGLAMTAVLSATACYIAFKPAGSVIDLAIYPLTAFIILAVLWSGPSGARTLLRSRALLWLGSVSYSLYMSQAATTWFINQAVRVLVHRPEATGFDGKHFPALSLAEGAALYAFTLCAVLLMAYLTYRLVESPGREASRRLAVGSSNIVCAPFYR
jgi:peptidoglycan/LPS O-acetylase OafA/YrhL